MSENIVLKQVRVSIHPDAYAQLENECKKVEYRGKPSEVVHQAIIDYLRAHGYGDSQMTHKQPEEDTPLM